MLGTTPLTDDIFLAHPDLIHQIATKGDVWKDVISLCASPAIRSGKLLIVLFTKTIDEQYRLIATAPPHDDRLERSNWEYADDIKGCINHASWKWIKDAIENMSFVTPGDVGF